MAKKVLFIDRDGTIIEEPPITYQVDTIDQLRFVPKVIRNLSLIATNLDYELVLVSNQDGLGREQYPEERFWPLHNLVMDTLKSEGVIFANQHIDPSMPEDNSPCRKPNTGMLVDYFSQEYDLANSFVIGDRLTDIQLAKNLGAKGILIGTEDSFQELMQSDLLDVCALSTYNWDDVYEFLRCGTRVAQVVRNTKETNISIEVDLDGKGTSVISTGLGFFDHMLDQIARHSGISMQIEVKGDLHVDEHHTIEDTGIALGEALRKALGDKRGIERYGFVLPMDDSLASVALDFGGRSWLVWNVNFKRERVGDVPTEMFYHFFKSLSDSAQMNLNIKAEGDNDHHLAEGIFKAFAKAIKNAIRRDPYKYELPSTKGVI